MLKLPDFEYGAPSGTRTHGPLLRRQSETGSQSLSPSRHSVEKAQLWGSIPSGHKGKTCHNRRSPCGAETPRGATALGGAI